MQEITVKRRNVQKAAEGQRQFIVTRAFRHAGELYLANDIISTDEATAKQWIEIECLEPLGAR